MAILIREIFRLIIDFVLSLTRSLPLSRVGIDSFLLAAKRPFAVCVVFRSALSASDIVHETPSQSIDSGPAKSQH